MSHDLAQPGDLLFQEISQLIDAAKQRAAAAINAKNTLLYWQVGSRIQTEASTANRSLALSSVASHRHTAKAGANGNSATVSCWQAFSPIARFCTQCVPN